MKKIYFAGAFVLIFFTGCSSTYKVTDFPTKEKFYEEINTTLNQRPTKVTLRNDSVLAAQAGLVLKNDQLTCYSKVIDKRNRKIPLQDLASVNFNGQEKESAFIKKKNGEEFVAEDVSTVMDSLQFTEVRNLTKITVFPIDSVKSVSYTSLWKAMSVGGMIGWPSFGILGYYWGKSITQLDGGNSGDRSSQEFSGFVMGIFAGSFLGAISGFFWEYLVVYEFPSK